MFFLCLLLSVFAGPADLVDKQATPATVSLRDKLKSLESSTSFIFGQEMPSTYKYKSGFSTSLQQTDSKDVTGDHPGLFGADFHYIFSKSPTEATTQKDAVAQANTGGSFVSFDWHMYSSKAQTYGNDGTNTNLVKNIVNLADTTGDRTWFFGQLDQVITVFKSFNFPILFRPFHEMNGNWFWWGNQATADYVQLFKMTVDYLKAQGVHNVLYVWSPNEISGGRKFWEYYPGDDYVDIVGFDGYEPGLVSWFTTADFLSLCAQITDYAATHNKIAAITETGARGGNSIESTTNFWTTLLNTITNDSKAKRIAYLQTWINGGWEKPYIPYSGMPQSGAVTDFQIFYADPNTLFQSETKQLFLNSPVAPPTSAPVAPIVPPVASPVASPVAPVASPVASPLASPVAPVASPVASPTSTPNSAPVAPPTIPPDANSQTSNGLSGGAIAGIVIGVIVAIALFIALTLYVTTRSGPTESF